jgi:tRNA pseudouridine38-40 synthase
MALYQLILAYDGTDFSGFQRQGKGKTVQGVVEAALVELGWHEESILFAGRTDAGVHATGQVISFNLDWGHQTTALMSALNARLPSTISVINARMANAEFHPRYDATSRTYKYSIYHQPSCNPLLDRYAWRIWPVLDLHSLKESASEFLGRKDFSCVGRAMKPGSNTIREVFSCNWEAIENGSIFTISANAFLYHMVRRIVYLQVQYANKKLSGSDLRAGLVNRMKLNPGLAPAKGLVLAEVGYSGEWQGVLEEDIE